MKGILLTTLLCIASAAGAAPVYRWVDANGQVHYSDKAPEKAQNLKRLRDSDLPHVHGAKPPPKPTQKYRQTKPQANVVKASKNERLCRNYRKRLDSTEEQLNRRSLDQDRDRLWKERDIYAKKVREFCD